MNARSDYESTIQLIKLAQNGDEDAKQQLVVENVALVKSMLRKYLNRGCEYDDLYQIGCLGLIKAIIKFDTSMEVKFSTYAVPVILGEIRRHLRDDGQIHVSRSLKELSVRVYKCMEQLREIQGREPTVTEISGELGVSIEDITLALGSIKPVRSIYEPIDQDGDMTLGDTLSDYKDELTDSLHLKEMIGLLPVRERQIIILRYFQERTQADIAKLLGVSQVQVSRIESKVLKKLRDMAS